MTSVLFDGVIPELTGLDGNEWASQLIVFPSTPRQQYALSVVAFYFTGMKDYTGIERVEMAVFNCPEWGISVGSISVQEFTNGRGRTLAIRSTTVTSCDSLVRVCVPVSTNSTVIPIMFHSVPSPLFYVHLAEVTFYSDSSVCPPEAIVSAGTVTTHRSPDHPTTTSSSEFSSSTPCSTGNVACPSCTTSNSLASVIAAIVTALLASVTFTLAQIAICKCRQKLRAEEHRKREADEVR